MGSFSFHLFGPSKLLSHLQWSSVLSNTVLLMSLLLLLRQYQRYETRRASLGLAWPVGSLWDFHIYGASPSLAMGDKFPLSIFRPIRGVLSFILAGLSWPSASITSDQLPLRSHCGVFVVVHSRHIFGRWGRGIPIHGCEQGLHGAGPACSPVWAFYWMTWISPYDVKSHAFYR